MLRTGLNCSGVTAQPSVIDPAILFHVSWFLASSASTAPSFASTSQCRPRACSIIERPKGRALMLKPSRSQDLQGPSVTAYTRVPAMREAAAR